MPGYVVVCRPRPSDRRICCVAITVAPASALTSVDLPEPDVPIRPSVRPGRDQGADPVEVEAGLRR